MEKPGLKEGPHMPRKVDAQLEIRRIFDDVGFAHKQSSPLPWGLVQENRQLQKGLRIVKNQCISIEEVYKFVEADLDLLRQNQKEAKKRNVPLGRYKSWDEAFDSIDKTAEICLVTTMNWYKSNLSCEP